MNHPDSQTLLQYQAGELSAQCHSAVSAHLGRCDRCRLELDRLPVPRPQPAAAPAGDVLNGIRKAIRHWDARKASPERSGEALKSRVMREIGPFLGDQAARQLLAGVSDSGHNLLSSLEQVLGNFLGERAAAHLVSHVVDAAIVGNNH